MNQASFYMMQYTEHVMQDQSKISFSVSLQTLMQLSTRQAINFSYCVVQQYHADR